MTEGPPRPEVFDPRLSAARAKEEAALWEALYEVCESRDLAEALRRYILDEAMAKAKDRRRMLRVLVTFMIDTVRDGREVTARGGSRDELEAFVEKRMALLNEPGTAEELIRRLFRDQLKVIH